MFSIAHFFPPGQGHTSQLWLALAVTIGLVVYRVLQIGKRDPRLPPGPPTVPILGNIHQIPPTGLYKKFRDWADEYGKVFSLKIGPTTFIVLADRQAIHTCLVEHGAKYSGRREGYILKSLSESPHEVMGISASDDTKQWREKRKIISHYLSPKQLDEKHYKVQEAEATVLMNNLLVQPDDFYREVRRYTASVITSLTFGYRAKDIDSWWATGVYEAMDKFTEVMQAGAMPPVDEFPFLKWVPERFARWKRIVAETRKVNTGVWAEGRRRLEARRATGVRRNCVGDLILDDWEKKGSWPITDYGFTGVLAEFVAGGADTTSSQILTLILAFAKHPEVQRKAQQEIDAVCGTSRSPMWADFEALPYLNCIVKEGMRWRPTAVSAIPHRLKEDDYYEGYLLPKDSLVFLPTWAIHHSERIYPEPDKFMPERYAGHKRLAPDYAGSPDWEKRDHYNYGAGRRICPGLHLAERNMWRIAGKLLWAFDFAEPIDPSTGRVIPLDDQDYFDGILVAPNPFKVRITPRSHIHTDKIKSEIAEALDFLSQYDE